MGRLGLYVRQGWGDAVVVRTTLPLLAGRYPSEVHGLAGLTMPPYPPPQWRIT